jgi:hypothetical protein
MLQEHQLFLQQQEHQQQQDADQERCQQQEGVTAMEVKRSATPLEQQTSSSTGSPLLLAPGEEAGGQASQGAVTGEALGTWSLHFMAEGWYPVSGTQVVQGRQLRPCSSSSTTGKPAGLL